MHRRKDLLDIESLDREEIDFVLHNARPMKELFARSVKKVPPLMGKTVLTLFYEPSTRTRTSFEIAAKRLSADVVHIDVDSSSVTKGETVLDTIDTLQSMKVDYFIVRHQRSGIPDLIARNTKASVINAGDGNHAHPTQAFLDAFTLQEVFGEDLTGRRILIVGDLLHSRVARSTSRLLIKLGAEVGVFGPCGLIPEQAPAEFKRFASWSEAFDWKPDATYLLRIQLERMSDQFFPSLGEYHKNYGITDKRLDHLRREGIYLLHPGPVNRGVEVSDAAMKYERSLINTQVENGIAARMSILYWLQPQVDHE